MDLRERPIQEEEWKLVKKSFSNGAQRNAKRKYKMPVMPKNTKTYGKPKTTPSGK